ncbi:pyrroline-5-carboxylate reductase [Chitinibacter sp. ZOR0017]|uniref:pyrroline-5-carboxylate reductase n=1 Tax=Chitinibacter sp. ZOR0017 TaxID=1339254 RepID=UPI000648047E|nr:pyrroline-5-carboxylate reductase [Chitinibacter sp. ZOR0017]
MTITFIGGGNMATAMIGGMLSQGFSSQDIHVIEPDAGKRAELTQQYGISTSAPGEAFPASEAVLFAVKPQQFKAVTAEVLPHLGNALVISIAAGIRVDTLSRFLQGHSRIIRVMPNTPALVQAGISGVYASEAVSEADRALTSRILASIGEQVWVEEESQIDGITAISGSGPAYIFYFMEALQAAARAQGFSPDIAHKLAYQTFAGAVKLALNSDDDAGTLQQKVTSKGGTTERAIKALETSQVRSTIIAAAAAAAARSRELGEELGRDIEP